jgi:hypothetical protein
VIELVSVRQPHQPGSLRLGTLSWSVPRRDRQLLDPDQFLATLVQVHAGDPEPWDLLLASGRTLVAEPSAEDVMAQAVGSAVLFEVINPGGSTARWVLVHGGPQPRADRLRSEQILVRGGDDPTPYNRLAAELAAGGGVIRIPGNETRLVLLICDENNALNTYGKSRSALCRSGPGLADHLGGRWIALNPSHSAYWPQSKMKGFAKFGWVGGVGRAARPSPGCQGTRMLTVKNTI